jgi:transposase
MDKGKALMEIKPQLERAAAFDIHQEKITVCFFVKDELIEVKEYGTFTEDLFQLRDDCLNYKIHEVLMESTGVYWIPICAIMTDAGIKVHVVNAKFVKNMPKEKTDKKDAKWLCKLLVNGQIRDSYIAPTEQQAFRDLCRSRKKYTNQITQARNRMSKFLDRRNIKLTNVISNLDTLTAREIIKALSEGETDIEKLASLARGKLKKKKELLRKALQGILTEHDRKMLKMLLSDISHFEQNIAFIDEEIKKHVDRVDPKLVEKLDEIAGIGKETAQIILAEIGDNVDAWENADKLAAWAGSSPGNNESANKQKKAGRRSGNKFLLTSLVQAAWGAVRIKNSYWQALYWHLRKRLIEQKAIIAIVRRLVKIIYKVIKGIMTYKELGGVYFKLHLQERLEQKRNHNIILKNA